VSTEALLARLARLDAADRAWLLGELPPALRRELVELLTDEEEMADPTPSVAPPAGWDAFDPELAAQALDAEPAWLVSAATRAAGQRWRERFLQATHARRRHEIEIEDRAGRTLGTRAAALLLEACRERMGRSGSEATQGEPRSRFASLVEQMRSRFA
jgi:hypothetical protein